MLLIAEGTVTVQGPDGQRDVAAADLFQDYLETAIEPGEVLTEVRVPALDGLGLRLPEVQPPQRGLGDGRGQRARQADRRHLRGRPRRAHQHGLGAAAGERGRGGAAGPAAERRERSPAAAEQAAEGTDPPADLNASADYKRHLARVLCRRALEEAAGLHVRRAALNGFESVEAASAALAAQGYLADRPLALAVHLAVTLEQPLLLEGEAGVGKTEVARALARRRPARG